MSDLTAVRRRREELQEMKQNIEEELNQLDVAEKVLLRLSSSQYSDGPATVSMNLTDDLDGKSAAEAARWVLSKADPQRNGLHYTQILGMAIRVGYRKNDEDPAPDTMRRALSKRSDWFEQLGEGIFRLKG